MSMTTIPIQPAPLQEGDVFYPDCDGEPMSDNTLQWDWMVTIKENLEIVFRQDPLVFVGGDLLWYPVEGSNTTRMAPDVMVALGRPKGRRGSYRQWAEGGIPPQVVFEIVSPGNRFGEMVKKLAFYERYGVEEYYVYNPDSHELVGMQRSGERLLLNEAMADHTSPRLGIRFLYGPDDLKLFRPDGTPFLTVVELATQAEAVSAELAAERERTQRLVDKLRSLGVDPDA